MKMARIVLLAISDKIKEGRIKEGSTIATASSYNQEKLHIRRCMRRKVIENMFLLTLEAGSLILMGKDSQELLQHEVKKDDSKNRRISITGRWIRSDDT